MSTPYEEKIKEFTKRLENEDVFIVYNELITYLQGMVDNENNPIRKELFNSLIISMTLLKGLSTVAKEVGKQNDETKSQFNSLLERIIKLENRFDDLEAGK